ncbi:MAG: hypothetical protein WCL11_06475, partial [Verrucomicrobiota bacterium]
EAGPAEWSFSLEPPPPTWDKPGYDDAAWKRGPGGFGTEGTPGEDGLINLRQRMTEIGGRFEQQSEPGRGTRTSLVAPWEAEAL